MGNLRNIAFVMSLVCVRQVLTINSPDLQQKLHDLDSFIQNLMTCETRPVVGLTVSVVKDGQTIFAKGYGQRDLQTGQAVDNRTLFGVGSISKSFTSALLADVLGEREDVSWDTALTDILGPSFRFRDEFRTKEANLRDLLAHKMGLENLGLAEGSGQDIDRAELTRRIRHYRQVYPFRTYWHFNNAMYTLSGHVAEKLTGKPFESLLRERLLQPLGLDDTTYLADALEEGDLSNFAQTYLTYNQMGQSETFSRENFRIVKLHLPAGGVASNALDMARYMNFHLSLGRDSSGRKVVPEEPLRQTHTADFVLPADQAMDRLEPAWPDGAAMVQGSGMGWLAGSYRGYRRVHHNGFVAGFSSLLSLFPATSGGVFTSANGPWTEGARNYLHQVIHNQVGDILIGKDHWLNTTTACTYPEPWWTPPKANGTVPPDPPHNFPRDKRDYESVYGNRTVGNITVSLNSADDNLYFKLGLIGGGRVLATETANRLLFRNEGPTVYIPEYVVDVGVKNGKIFNLTFLSYPEPPVVFERGLNLTDPDPTLPIWDECIHPVSGAPCFLMISPGTFILLALAFLTALNAI